MGMDSNINFVMAQLDCAIHRHSTLSEFAWIAQSSCAMTELVEA